MRAIATKKAERFPSVEHLRDEIEGFLRGGSYFDSRTFPAGTVIIKGGSVSGNVRAHRSIELYVPARVSGTLQAPEVFMDKGVQFSGSCTMAPLEPVP